MREELAAIRTALGEHELELVELRRQLAVFQGRYLREVGTLYAELDEWKARIAELRARCNPSPFRTCRRKRHANKPNRPMQTLTGQRLKLAT